MPTLVMDPQPLELTKLIERRRRLGQDLFDEVWDGVLHMNPGPAGGHARIGAQVVVALQTPGFAAALTLTGQFNVGDDEQLPRAGCRAAP